MSSTEVDTIDCTVPIRNYVLVSKPSRWKQKSQRVVVQSPMLTISNTILEVPVRRFNGEEENVVCFLPKQDIEKDTSSIYEKEQVSKVPSWLDAHGVALFDSTPSDDFMYCRGHQFWICIGTNTDGYDTSVPVINLQTCEKGDIDIDQVSWFPKIQGPSKQLWTLGGGTRKRQLSGARKFSYYSWAICQRLDGTSTTTETIEIPTKEVKLEGKRRLSTSESRSLFNKILQCMTGDQFDDADQTNQSESPSWSPGYCSRRSQVIVLPTPPKSPGNQYLQLQQLQQLQKEVSIQAQHSRPLPSPWRGIFELSGRMNGRYILRNSLIRPQELALTRTQIRQSLLPAVETASKDIDRSMSNNFITVHSKRPPFCNTRESSAHHTRDSSPSRAQASDEELYNHDTPSSESSEMIDAAEILVEMSRNIYLDAASPREAWEAHKPPENPMFTALCSLRNPNCLYTTLSTRLHYHCPPEKCKLSRPISIPSQQQRVHRDEYHADNHTHCVSRLGPFPDSAGECHLQNSRFRFPNHKCCYWDEEDLKTVPTRGQRPCESKKLEEARKKGMRIMDRSGLVGNGFDVEREVTMLDLNLDDGGRELEAALNSGLHEVEIAKCLFAAEYQGAEGEVNF